MDRYGKHQDDLSLFTENRDKFDLIKYYATG